MVLCLTVQEDLKPPIAVFVEPTEKNEKFCFGEDKDPLELCCDNAASIKQEEGLFTEVSGAASSAGTSNEAAAGCVSDEEIHGSHRHLCIHAENEHGPDSIEEIARDDITFICDVSPLHRTMCSRFPKASGVRCQYPGRDL
ncbi:Protein of unknown function [Gryllus bimaculatus]|nr:Protein of unknown function [Gryllus bimaculatus]